MSVPVPSSPPAAVDLHTHLLPGVDDGAADAREAGRAARALAEQGVGAAAATPHLQASITTDPGVLEERLAAFDVAWGELRAAVSGSGGREGTPVELDLHRGAEVRLDDPAPDFSDDRIRLDGTRFVLVEFSHLRVPPYGQDQLRSVLRSGWTPVLAHPERYRGVLDRLEVAQAWREAGAVLQANAGSLVGQHGREARRAAWRMLERGWVQLLATDYHARGAPRLREALGALSDRLEDAGDGRGREIPELLLHENPSRILADERPLPVPPLPEPRGLWARIRRLLGGG